MRFLLAFIICLLLALPASASAAGCGPGQNLPTVTDVVTYEYADTFAVLEGTIETEGLPTTYYFAYGENTINHTTATKSTTENTTTLAELPTLTPGTTYIFELVASNACGTTVAEGETFTTLTEAELKKYEEEPEETSPAESSETVEEVESLSAAPSENGPRTSSHAPETESEETEPIDTPKSHLKLTAKSHVSGHKATLTVTVTNRSAISAEEVRFCSFVPSHLKYLPPSKKKHNLKNACFLIRELAPKTKTKIVLHFMVLHRGSAIITTSALAENASKVTTKSRLLLK